jgi:hypothetical protein
MVTAMVGPASAAISKELVSAALENWTDSAVEE